jgi:(S)-ureidoglycine---glyoxylate transaminase
VIGQFDPAFTAIMDDVMALARRTFLTENRRCFAVSALASGGLEALFNSLLGDGDQVAVGGGPRFVAETAAIARRYGADVIPLDRLGAETRLVVAPLIDPTLGTLVPIRELARRCHTVGAKLVVEATHGLAATELRIDEWHVDASVAGADYAVGAPSGMTLVTYSAEVEALMLTRPAPPRTSYLDLLQLQAYWSPERLNHHTAPTTLVYGLREALRLVECEGLAHRWQRHQQVGDSLREGLRMLGHEVSGDGPYAIVRMPPDAEEGGLRQRLLQDFGIHVRPIDAHTWRIGLLGADARPETAQQVLLSLGKLLTHA